MFREKLKNKYFFFVFHTKLETKPDLILIRRWPQSLIQPKFETFTEINKL